MGPASVFREAHTTLDERVGTRPKVESLIQLGALLALGATTNSLRATVDRARAAGVIEAEIVGVPIAVGRARLVAAASRLAASRLAAIGYDLAGRRVRRRPAAHERPRCVARIVRQDLASRGGG